jgi:rubrerythrin
MKRFTRTEENFICDHCGAEVVGNGYTNHCPKCLWGKHVDVNPGDRAESCHGLMEPIGVEKQGEGYDIIFKCERCGVVRKNKSAPADDFQMLVRISN